MITAEKISLAPPPVNMKEIIRYAGCCDEDAVRLCLAEAESVLTYNVCFAEVPVSVSGDTVDMEWAKVKSHHLAKNLDACPSAVIFAATVGHGMDRLIGKYTRLSPSRAVILQAIGSERVESLCDAFENYLKERLGGDVKLRPRYSPGYGDLPLVFQREVFGLLDCCKNLGISLGESLLMTPEKSVTAIIGIEG